jgi:TRAP-type C4-dicarboxylate transport system substrate-binding protein
MVRLIIVALLAVFVLGVPGSPRRVEADGEIELRVATLAPRNSPFMRDFERLVDKRLRQETNGAVRISLYPSGSAGDETDMLRKMRAGQLDAAMITSEGLGLILPEVNVLRAPGIITTYQQLESVQKVMLPQFDRSFEAKGFKLIAWGEAGEYRYFSRQPVYQPADIRKMRPWLWPSSPIMKETWQAIGAVGVPLGMAEVYGALQTRMVDLVESTAIAYTAFMWHTTDLAYVTEATSGVLVGAWLMNKSAFDKLRPEWQAVLLRLAEDNNQSTRLRTREGDAKAYDLLVKRGLKVTKFTPSGEQQLAAIRKQVREHLVGRVYSADLLAQVQQVAGASR